MKAKRLVALAVSAAMVVGTASLLTACGKKDPAGTGGGGGGSSSYVYYAVGCDTEGTLGTDMTNGWDPTLAREEATFVQDETNANLYTLTLDIYEGNVGTGYSFKFVYKTSADESLDEDTAWGRQFGIENIEGYAGEGETGYVMYNDVKLFTTAGGKDAHNIALTENNEGTYKFTLDTSTSKTSPKLKVELVEKIVVTHKMYIYGDINNFGWGNGQTKYPMTKQVNGDTTTWIYQLEITEADLRRNEAGEYVWDEDLNDNKGGVIEGETAVYAAVHLYNMKNGASYVDASYDKITIAQDDLTSLYSDDAEFMLLPEGKYFVTFDQATNSAEFSTQTHVMYFRGDHMSWGTTITEDDAQYKLNESSDGSFWYGFLAVPEGETHLVKCFNALDASWYGDGEDNIELTEGIWYVKFDVKTGEIETTIYDDIDGIFVTGTLYDEENDYHHFAYKEGDPQLVATDVSCIMSTTITLIDAADHGQDLTTWGAGEAAEGAVMAIQAVFVKDGAIDWATNGNGNYFVKGEVGATYNATFNLNTHEWSFTLVED